MTETVAPPAAQLQVSHASGLHSVSRMLAGMHREMLRSGGTEGAHARLSVVNLVAACVDLDSADLATQTIAHVGAKHAARAIVVVADPTAESRIEADLSLQCLRAGDRQICIEQVRLEVSGPPAYHLASVVTPLLVPDIPVFLWLAGAPPVRQAFGQDAIAICERLIIDSGAYADATSTLITMAAEMEAVGDAISVCDVTWERLHPWRQLVANAFDGAEMRPYLCAVERVEISCGGDTIGAQSWLLAGWLASRLGWGDRAASIAIDLIYDDTVDERDLARVVVHCRQDGSGATVTLERTAEMLHAAIDIADGLHAERALQNANRGTVELVSQLLEQGGEDPVYRAALARGAALAASHGR